MARIGVFGGSFNPIHLGHLHIAAMVEETEHLDRILFVPAKNPPHKSDADLAPERARVEMIRLALESRPRWELDCLELEQDASPYTVDTLDRLAARSPRDQFVFIMGWDSLGDFPRWKDPEGILSRHTVVAVDRPGVEDPQAGDLVGRCRTLRGNPLGIRATDIRHRLGRGLSVRYLLPESVHQYLEQTNAYIQT